MTIRDIKILFEIYKAKKKYGYDFGDLSLLKNTKKKNKN